MHRMRRTLLVDTSFQFEFLGWFCISAFPGVILMYFQQRYLFSKIAEIGAAHGIPQSHPFMTALSQTEPLFTLAFFATILFQLILSLLIVLWTTNKIVGPLQRFKSHIMRKAAGEKTGEIHFRDDDYFQELAEAYNKSVRD